MHISIKTVSQILCGLLLLMCCSINWAQKNPLEQSDLYFSSSSRDALNRFYTLQIYNSIHNYTDISHSSFINSTINSTDSNQRVLIDIVDFFSTNDFQSCSLLAERSGTYQCSITMPERVREYILIVPRSYQGRPTPLVIDMHGFLHDSDSYMKVTHWSDDETMRRKNYIYVVPIGFGRSWNADVCCAGNKEDDVSFIRAIVEEVGGNFNLDIEKIFAVGFSNGGGLAHKLGCEAADVFTGIVSASFPNPKNVETCQPSRPVEVIHFHGTADFTVRYNGGIFGVKSAPDSFNDWAEILNCQVASTVTYVQNNTVCETYEQCQGGVKNTLCTVDSFHSIYDNADYLNLANVGWVYLNGGVPKNAQEVNIIDLEVNEGSFLFFRWMTLSWTGVISDQVDVYRNGVLFDTTKNDGLLTDIAMGVEAVYQVCEPNSRELCSQPTKASFY